MSQLPTGPSGLILTGTPQGAGNANGNGNVGENNGIANGESFAASP